MNHKSAVMGIPSDSGFQSGALAVPKSFVISGFDGGLGCEPTPAIRLLTLASRATRLPRVPSTLPSISFGTRVWVLAGFDDSPLKDNRKTGPNRNGRGSPKLRLRTIQ